MHANTKQFKDLRIQTTPNDEIHITRLRDISTLDGGLSPLTPLPPSGPTTLNRSKGQVLVNQLTVIS
jgi:hypothetical protein